MELTPCLPGQCCLVYFSLEMQHYARMMPVHLTHLYELKASDKETWEFFKTNFTCDETLGQPTVIGVDHALEQVKKELKGLRGIQGKSNAEIDRFRLIAPTKRTLITQFADVYLIF